MLPRKTRALIRPTYDPKKTPFLERKKDIARVYQALPVSFNVAFAISALAGARSSGTPQCSSPNDTRISSQSCSNRRTC